MFAWYHFFMKKGDFLVLLIFLVPSLVVCLLFGLDKSAGATVNVYVGGEITASVSLFEDRTMDICGLNGITDTLCINDGEAYILDALCPGKDCLQQGPISKNGEAIVCAPAGIMICIESEEEAEYDALTR